MVDIQTILMLLLTIGSGVAIGVGLQNALSTKTAKVQHSANMSSSEWLMHIFA
jgi:hypothetical protein